MSDTILDLLGPGLEISFFVFGFDHQRAGKSRKTISSSWKHIEEEALSEFFKVMYKILKKMYFYINKAGKRTF